jgi:hypothetical protein
LTHLFERRVGTGEGEIGFHMSQSAASSEAVVAVATLFGEGGKARPLRRGRAFPPSLKVVVTATTTSRGAATWLMWKPRLPCSCPTYRFEKKRRAGRMRAPAVTTSFVHQKPEAETRADSNLARSECVQSSTRVVASSARTRVAGPAVAGYAGHGGLPLFASQRDRCDDVRMGSLR